jgi:hypothetical protein
LAFTAGLLLAGQATVPSAGAATVTIAPTTAGPGPANAYPFGISPVGEWGTYMGFVYKNVPAFQLKTGDVLGFDLAGVNDVDIGLEIGMAATAVNGGDVPSQPFTTVVQNTQTPLNPRGDTVLLNYELRFTSQAPFSFPGGGLIIRFTNPSATFAADTLQTAVIPDNITSADASGFFVKRVHGDPDGIAPWAAEDNGDIAPVQFTLADPPQPTKKKKCKKKRKKGKSAAAAKKKKCKKKRKKR